LGGSGSGSAKFGPIALLEQFEGELELVVERQAAHCVGKTG